MKIETLKQLIKREINLSEDKQDLEATIMALLDIYEQDSIPTVNIPWVYPHYEPQYKDNNYTIYADICGCNPKNGGTGICGCTIANKQINPDSFLGNWTVTYTYDDKKKDSGNS